MRVAIYVLTGVALALSTGCPHGSQLCVSPVDTSSSGLSFKFGEGIDCAEAPHLATVDVYQNHDSATRWSLSASSPTALQKLTYGVIPQGFTQSLPPSKLQPGDTVSLSIRGPGVVGGMDVKLK